MNIIKKIDSFLDESEKEFWQDVYKNKESHWEDKNVSNLTKKVVSKFKKFDNVLEIGCAAGIDTFYLAKYTRNKIVGIDIVSDIIKKAKENLSKEPINIQRKISFEIGDAEKLKFEDKSFDFVYSLSVLHSTDVSKSIKEVRRVLTDDGKAVIYVYIGGNKEEGMNKKKFIDAVSSYFKIIDQKEVDVSDSANDKHTALITWLEVK